MPVVLALLLSGVVSFSYNRLLKDYRDAVDHTFQTLSGIDNAPVRLQDAETGQRGLSSPGITNISHRSRPVAWASRKCSDGSARWSPTMPDKKPGPRS
jgi:hypothetical protein